MDNVLVRKIMILTVVCLFIGSGIVPSITGNDEDPTSKVAINVSGFEPKNRSKNNFDVILSEGFESGVIPPAGWILEQHSVPPNPYTWELK